MFLIDGFKIKNIVSVPEDIGRWLVLNGIPLLSRSEKGEYIFSNTKAFKKQMSLLPNELKGGGQ